MADIEIKCAFCGRTVTVSEFVDADALYCHACGEKLEKPAGLTRDQKKRLLVHRPDSPSGSVSGPSDMSPAAPGETTEWRFHQRTRKRGGSNRRSRFYVSTAVRAWALFAVLATLSFSIRYRQLIPTAYLRTETIVFYGPIVVAAFHIFATLKAFKDSVFHGILCVVLPPYSLYYTFLVGDDFYLRAVYGAILAGTGHDTYCILRDFLIAAYHFIKHWIEYGALH